MTRFRNSLSKSRSRSSTPESQPKTAKVETPDQQARHLIGRHLALRTSRHEWKVGGGKFTASEPLTITDQTLARASTYMQQMGHDQGLRDMTEDYFREYLESRAPGLTTKNLGYEANLLPAVRAAAAVRQTPGHTRTKRADTSIDRAAGIHPRRDQPHRRRPEGDPCTDDLFHGGNGLQSQRGIDLGEARGTAGGRTSPVQTGTLRGTGRRGLLYQDRQGRAAANHFCSAAFSARH